MGDLEQTQSRKLVNGLQKPVLYPSLLQCCLHRFSFGDFDPLQPKLRIGRSVSTMLSITK